MKYRRSARDAAVLALLVVMVLIVVAGMGCGPKFKLQAIASESVPAEVRERPPASSPRAANIVWRTIIQQPSFHVVGVTYDLSSPSGTSTSRCYAVGFYTLDPEGKLNYQHGGGTAVPAECFAGSGGRAEYGSASTSPGRYDLSASGIAFHPRAAKVVGATSKGREVECEVVNGFWGLWMINTGVDEDWTSVNALDADGRVIFRYLVDGRWRVGNIE